MNENMYSENEIGHDLEFVAKKLDWSAQEFKTIINLPPNRHKNFASNEHLFNFGMKSKKYLKYIFSKIQIPRNQ